jgi:hypothetical protein
MAQHLGDLGQRCTVPDHPGRQAVAEQVGDAPPMRTNPGPVQRQADNVVDRTRPRQADARRDEAEKDPPRRTRAPVLAEILRERVPVGATARDRRPLPDDNLNRQWNPRARGPSPCPRSSRRASSSGMACRAPAVWTDRRGGASTSSGDSTTGTLVYSTSGPRYGPDSPHDPPRRPKRRNGAMILNSRADSDDRPAMCHEEGPDRLASIVVSALARGRHDGRRTSRRTGRS